MLGDKTPQDGKGVMQKCHWEWVAAELTVRMPSATYLMLQQPDRVSKNLSRPSTGNLLNGIRNTTVRYTRPSVFLPFKVGNLTVSCTERATDAERLDNLRNKRGISIKWLL
eukprot:TRINITY_DN13056_c0_g3_i4.p2 TRINITY_DN13056_c0_g3~~TRINITY_DN13056_c0_g3_i4.p2  ORF type:complete len:111 (-),score=0.49 TRINITY_DN13056_c0_g3_i4:150-482(-)